MQAHIEFVKRFGLAVRNAETQSSRRSSTGRNPPVAISRTEEIFGADVIGRDGRCIGELRDMLVDLRFRRVAYGVVALHHRPVRSERLIAVPWNAVHVDSNGNLRVNARRGWVERASAMQTGFMPTGLDHEWAMFIRAYFGAKPYWEREARHA